MVTDLPDQEEEFKRFQREMTLVDQVLGLQASLAQEATRNTPDRIRVEDLEREIKLLRASATWQIGLLVSAPLRFARQFSRRVVRRLRRRSVE